VFPIPGASAALAALTLAGLPTDRFLFAGFPPPKSAARKTFFEELAPVRATLIFYEGASRVADSLADMAAVFGPRDRRRGPRADQALRDLHPRPARRTWPSTRASKAPKGEIVILVGPGEEEVATAGDAESRPARGHGPPAAGRGRVGSRQGLGPAAQGPLPPGPGDEGQAG
jgi:16S rRNA (cytidine1402-2'-O)-methyltransferase